MKRETCFECKAELTQAGYDMQACACGWGPFGNPSPAAVTAAKLAVVREMQERELAAVVAESRTPVILGKLTSLAAAMANLEPPTDGRDAG